MNSTAFCTTLEETEAAYFESQTDLRSPGALEFVYESEGIFVPGGF